MYRSTLTIGALALLLVGGVFLSGCFSEESGTDALVGEQQETKNDAEAIGSELNTITINVTNSDGSITPVIIRIIRRKGKDTVFSGPRGEVYYHNLPTEDQLRPNYGF